MQRRFSTGSKAGLQTRHAPDKDVGITGGQDACRYPNSKFPVIARRLFLFIEGKKVKPKTLLKNFLTLFGAAGGMNIAALDLGRVPPLNQVENPRFLEKNVTSLATFRDTSLASLAPKLTNKKRPEPIILMNPKHRKSHTKSETRKRVECSGENSRTQSAH